MYFAFFLLKHFYIFSASSSVALPWPFSLVCLIVLMLLACLGRANMSLPLSGLSFPPTVITQKLLFFFFQFLSPKDLLNPQLAC